MKIINAGQNFKSIIKQDKFYIIIISVVVFCICAWYIPQRNALHLTSDEFSQYSIAAYLTGYNWSNIVNLLPYYQFGYPLIFVLPLFWIFGDDMLLIYQASLVVNALLAASIVPLIYYLLKNWGLKSYWENKYFIPITFMFALPGCIVAYSNLGLPEILLIVLGLLSTVLIAKISKNGASHKTVILLAFILVYGYASHMRFLGVTFSGMLVFFILVFVKKINIKYIISFIFVFITSFILAELLKNFFQTNLWLYETSVFGSTNHNDIIPNAERIKLLFMRSGFVGFIRTLIGQMWYMGFASFLLVYVGLLIILKDNIIRIKQMITKKMSSDYDFASLFIFLGFITTAVISALFMMHAGMGVRIRLDQFFYGRYNSIMLIPVSLYAISMIVNEKRKPYIIYVISIITFSFISAFISIFIDIHLRDLLLLYINVINHIVFSSIHFNSLLAINGFILIIISLHLKYKQVMLSIIVIAITCFNVYAGYLFITKDVIPNNHSEIKFDDFKKFKNYEELIFVADDFIEPSITLPRAQMALPNTHITVAYYLGDVDFENKAIIASDNYIYNLIINQRWNVNAIKMGYGLLSIHDIKYGENPIILPSFLFESEIGYIDDKSLISCGNAGFLISSPMFNLIEGSYIFSLQLELQNINNAPDIIGFIEYYSIRADKLLVMQPLYKDDFLTGKYVVDLDIEVNEIIYDIVFRLYVEDGVELQASDITVNFIDD